MFVKGNPDRNISALSVNCNKKAFGQALVRIEKKKKKKKKKKRQVDFSQESKHSFQNTYSNWSPKCFFPFCLKSARTWALKKCFPKDWALFENDRLIEHWTLNWSFKAFNLILKFIYKFPKVSETWKRKILFRNHTFSFLFLPTLPTIFISL